MLHLTKEARQQLLSDADSKELAATIVHATEEYKYREKLAELVLAEVRERLATAE